MALLVKGLAALGSGVVVYNFAFIIEKVASIARGKSFALFIQLLWTAFLEVATFYGHIILAMLFLVSCIVNPATILTGSIDFLFQTADSDPFACVVGVIVLPPSLVWLCISYCREHCDDFAIGDRQQDLRGSALFACSLLAATGYAFFISAVHTALLQAVPGLTLTLVAYGYLAVLLVVLGLKIDYHYYRHRYYAWAIELVTFLRPTESWLLLFALIVGLSAAVGA